MTRTRVAFVGGSGHHYLRFAVEARPQDFEVVFCPDPNDAEASQRCHAERLSMATPVASLDIALDGKPDVVSVGAVYAHNTEFIVPALERGIPVVSDKPIAASAADSRLVAGAARTPGARLISEFDFRSRPEIRAARAAIRDGRLGPLALLVIQKSYRWGERPAWYAQREHYGGTVLWIAGHGLDAVRFLAGEEVVRCTGLANNLSRPDFGSMEDHSANLLELVSGATALVHADLLRPAAADTHGDDRLRVVGRDGQIEIIDGRAWITTSEEGRRELEPEPTSPIAEVLLHAALGDEHPDYNTAESLATAELMLRCRDAADRRRWMPIRREGH